LGRARYRLALLRKGKYKTAKKKFSKRGKGGDGLYMKECY